MNSLDLLLMGLSNLLRRKTRTILTISGVTIGTCSIVVMISLSIAMDLNFQSQLKRMGSLTVIDVYPGSMFQYEPKRSNENSDVKLNDQFVSQFEKLAGVEAVLAQREMSYRFALGKLVADMQVIGVNPNKLIPFGFEIEEGRFPSDNDKAEIVFGAQTPYNFYNPRVGFTGGAYYMGPGMAWGGGNDQPKMPPPVDLISDKLIMTTDWNLGNRRQSDSDEDVKPPPHHSVNGVGILALANDQKDYSAYMNIKVLDRLIAEDAKVNRDGPLDRYGNNSNSSEYSLVKVKCLDIDSVAMVRDQIKAWGFQTQSLTDILESMQEQSRVLRLVLGGIGAISLLVAAIGITNTMIMSIYERTREIGLIKVIGAEISDIKKLFLIEAAMIGFLGGLSGVILSYAVSYLLNRIAVSYMGGMGGAELGISIIPLYLAAGALAFATMIGMLAGYTPARRATKMSVLEAFRTE